MPAINFSAGRLSAMSTFVRMRRTHLSLYYLAGYLVVAGIALIATGQFAMRLLLSNGDRHELHPRPARLGTAVRGASQTVAL